jgi:hypothetical protein
MIPVAIPTTPIINAPRELTLITKKIPTKIATEAKTNDHILITASGNNRCGINVRSNEIGPPRTVNEMRKTASMASDSKRVT